MRRYWLAITILAAAVPVSIAAKEQSLQELIAHANSAAAKDQPALYINIAERQLKAADELYNQGKVEEARAAVADVVTYSEKAHDAAVQSGKRLKPTEMASRRMSHRLRDLKRTLNFEDQAPVQAAADRLESLAQDLLTHMFGKGK
jgi:polyhydroxyalkanoate synthesis regulator phasin